MRVLYIASFQRTGGWLAEAFAADSASRVLLDEVVGTVAGLARLRDELFDAVLVSHEPGELYDRELADWTRHDFTIDNKASGAKSKPTMTECVWCNF